jgi:hypothetical protein
VPGRVTSGHMRQAPVPPTVEAVEAARKDDGYNGWTYHSRVSVVHRYLCIAVPKVASTTVKRTLHEFEGLPRAADSTELHSQGTDLALSTFSSRDIADMLGAADWLRFGFVRNPYDRVFSAWKSKIASTYDTQYEWLRDEIRAAYGYPERGDTDAPPMVNFRDFVDFVVASDAPRVVEDGHWDLQTSVLLHGLIFYDVLGRFEHFGDEFAAILDRLGATREARELASKVTNPTPQVPLPAAYDRTLADVVYRKYEPDFDAFGYRRDSWLFDG